MGLLSLPLKWLAEPRALNLDVDADERVLVHRRILEDKPMLEEVFREFYDLCMDTDAREFSGDGLRVELGAGVSLFKKYYPQIVTTDIAPAPHLDRVLDAQAMDLPDGSTRALFGINCFHHFPDPSRFFAELDRVLSPGGGCVLIEPYFGPIASRVYERLFKTEHFDPSQESWKTEDVVGPMRGANQALSYIVFVRDRDRFASQFPSLELLEMRPLTNQLRYLASGGLNFRNLVPNRLTFGLKAIERLAAPLKETLALHHVVVLRKRAAG